MIERNENADGSIVYLLNGVAHRTNSPARVSSNGYTSWWLFGGYHRYYGPCLSYGEWWIHDGWVKVG